jgi:oxygen-dependent protoporphyrinogen oxidase
VTQRVAVVGGGISGLTAAHRLRTDEGVSVTVYESGATVGGRAGSIHLEGRNLNLGAQFIADFYRDTLALIAELGLAGQVARRKQTAEIVRDLTPVPLWPLKELLTSPALSTTAKIRLLGLLPTLLRTWRDLDVHQLSRSRRHDRRTVAEHISRRCGREDLDYLFGPLLRALLYWDADTTSMTVANAALKAFLTSHRTLHFPDGLQQLSDRLAAGVEVTTGVTITAVHPEGTEYQLIEADGRRHGPFDAVVLAVPAPVALRLWAPLADYAFLRGVDYSRSVHLAFEVDAGAPDYPSGSTLFALSASPGIASFNSTFDPACDSGPGARRLISVFLSDQGYQQLAGLDDPALSDAVLGILADQIRPQVWHRNAVPAHVQRWEFALPKFDVGYVAALTLFKRTFRIPGLALAGDYLVAPYIDGAVTSGIEAAAGIAAHLRTRRHLIAP